MYKQQPATQRSIRDTWQVLDATDPQHPQGVVKSATSRRSSAPITIFSTGETSNDNAATRGILPAHVGGVFNDSALEVESANATNFALNETHSAGVLTDSEALTSLGSALGEVLESVDEATQLHQQARSNARIQDWLGEQSSLFTEKKRKSSEADDLRIKRVTERIMRDLLGVDQNVLDILFRSKSAGKDHRTRQAALEMELKVWKRWIELTKRDTASLLPLHDRSSVKTTFPDRPAVSSTKGGQSLERIPWGVPEDSVDEEYWNEKISLPMVFRYLKSCITKSKMEKRMEDDSVADAEPSPKVSKTTISASAQTDQSATVTGESTINAVSVAPSVARSRQSLMRASRNTRRTIGHIRSRSRTSMSSSYRTTSHAGTCSVQSMRRSALGSHFWDLGSLGGASVSSREVGNWSVYA